MPSLAPLLTALLAWLAFPSVGLSPLALVAWAPLIGSLRAATPSQGFARGWVAGAGMNALGGAFLYAPLLRESGLSAPIAVLVFVLFAAYQGLRTALASWLATRARQRGWSLGLAFTLASMGLEAAFPLPFHWSFAASVAAWRPLVQIADLGGATLVSGVLVGVSASLVSLVSGPARRARTSTTWARSLAGFAVAGAALAYGAARLAAVEAAIAGSAHARLGVVETSRRAHEEADLPLLLERVNEAGARGAELVVTSESSLPGALPEEELDTAIRLAIGDRLRVDAVFGATIGADRPTNSALVVSPEGDVVERYDKHRLLPFAEYLPLAEAVPARWRATRAGGYRAGVDRPRRSGAIRAATSICYEDTLAEVVRASVNAGPANVLVNLTNDAWFEGSAEPDVHLALARLRAVELRRALVRSANLGRSAVIDPTGSVVVEPDADGVIVADVPLLDAPTVYQRIGEGPGWAALGVAVSLAAWRAPARRRWTRRRSGVRRAS